MACTWFVFAGAACVEPRSGVQAAGWCKNTDPEVELVDDMEDGNATLCGGRGGWSVVGTGDLAPGPGLIKVSADLPKEDVLARMPSVSYRGQHLGGTLEAGATAALVVSLGPIDLDAFDQIFFWARSELGTISLRVGAAVPATTPIAEGGTCDPNASDCGKHFGDDATIGEAWGDPTTEGPNNIAIGALSLDGMRPTDLSSVLALEFRFTGTGGPFSFWIDDLQLKRKPAR